MNLILRVLFSGNGFETKTLDLIDVWNQKNPNEPILLIQPTEELFGLNLCQQLKGLAGFAPHENGKTKLENALKLKKAPQ
jgi:hypothetical protein